jgi:hypothetical protein
MQISNLKNGLLFSVLFAIIMGGMTVNLAANEPAPTVTNAAASSSPIIIKLDGESLTNLVKVINDNKKDSNDLFIALVGTFIGTLLGFLFGFVTSWVAERNLAKRVLIAIQAEEKYIYSIYKDGLEKNINQLCPIDDKSGKRVENNKYYDQSASSPGVDWFSVYNGNTSNLGLLKEDHMRAVLETYAVMKGIIESFELNNALLEKLDQKKSTEGADAKPDGKLLEDLLYRAKDIRESHEAYLVSRHKLTSITVGRFYW